MPLTELVYYVAVAFIMTERADQLHHDNAPAHSTALVQVFIFFVCKTSHYPGLSAHLRPRFGSLRILVFHKTKITFEREEICESDVHTAYEFTQRRLSAN
jgi:hypothetical protein